MAKCKQKADPTAWRSSPAAIENYRRVKAEAQAKADSLGFDYGIKANDIFKEWSMFMLPAKKNRTGSELSCEVVMCSNLDKVQPGHGPLQ